MWFIVYNFVLMKNDTIVYVIICFTNETMTSITMICSAGFTYRPDRLKPRTSNFRGPPAKVYHIFNNVIGLSHLCCHNVLYFLNKPSVIFLTQLHSISEYCRILNTPHHHLRLYWNWLSTLKVGNWEGPHKWISLGPLLSKSGTDDMF
jgi:hypothetical protein